jgi:hypothetical protein
LVPAACTHKRDFCLALPAVHLVLYFRYLRFFPDGTFAYRTSPEPLGRMYRTLLPAPAGAKQAQRGRAGGYGGKEEHVHHGRFKQDVSCGGWLLLGPAAAGPGWSQPSGQRLLRSS